MILRLNLVKERRSLCAFENRFQNSDGGRSGQGQVPVQKHDQCARGHCRCQNQLPLYHRRIHKGEHFARQVGEVNVTFDTKGQFGDHYKLVSVILQGSNEPLTLELNGRIFGWQSDD